MTQRSTTRRTALAGLGVLGVVTTAGACSFLPGAGQDEEPADAGATTPEGGSGDDSGEQEEPTTEPGTTFDGWATEEDLERVEVDLEAADAEFGTAAGQVEREDRYGTWWSPGFPEDSPIFTREPLSIDPQAEEGLGGRESAVGAATGVLVQTIVHILDTPLLLEADNSRSDEVAPALVEGLGLDGVDMAAFDSLFAEVPVSGAVRPEPGLPESYGFEPLQYPADGPRMSILQANTEIEHLELEGQLSGPLVLASVRGALPIRDEDGRETVLTRMASFGVALDEAGRNVLFVYAVNAAPGLHIAEPTTLPAAAGTEVPADWTEHTLRDLTVSLPADLGEPSMYETGLIFQKGERRGSILRYALEAPSPYPLTATRHVARVEVPGAELAVASVGTGLDGTDTVGVSIHRGTEHFHVQIHDVDPAEAAVIAHQLFAGLRLGS